MQLLSTTQIPIDNLFSLVAPRSIDYDVEPSSREFASNSYVQVFPNDIIQEQINTMRNLTIFDVYNLYQSGTLIDKGAFGSVVVNKAYPYLAIKSIENFNVDTIHQHATPEDLLLEEAGLFQHYYGQRTARPFVYNYYFLEHDKNQLNQELVFFEGKRAFIVMLRMPGNNLQVSLNVLTYNYWLERLGYQKELSIRQMYLQLYSYLRDKGVYVYDLHSKNVLIRLDSTVDDNNAEIGMYPIDLSDYSVVIKPYEDRLCDFSSVLDELGKIRIQIEQLIGSTVSFLCIPVLSQGMTDLSYQTLFSYFTMYENKLLCKTKKQKLSIEELVQYQLLLHRFIFLMHTEVCLKMTSTEKSDIQFLSALECEFFNVYFFMNLLKKLEITETQCSNMY